MAAYCVGMGKKRFTAPQAGWYRFASGREPEFLGPDLVADDPHDPVAVWLQASGCPDLSLSMGSAVEITLGTEPIQ